MKQAKQKTIYLTIDDCPSKDFRKKINFLIKNKIPAILFCIGKEMKEYPKDIVYAIKNGFVIGNHSYSHPNFSIIHLKDAEQQIKLTDKIIDRLHKKANVKRKIKLFRFPYGNEGAIKRTKIQKILKQLGYKQPEFKNINYKWYNLKLIKGNDVLWTYDISEYKFKRLEEVFEKILHMQGKLSNLNSRDIVLIHDHAKTTKWFFKILNKLIEKNIKFILPEIK